MSYSPTTWTDGTTPVNASNMNKIENALSDQDSRIDELGNSATLYVTSASDLFSQVVSAGANKVHNIFLTIAAVSEITNGAVSAIGFGISVYISTSYVDFAFFANNARVCYSGRLTTGGELFALYRLSPTSISV